MTTMRKTKQKAMNWTTFKNQTEISIHVCVCDTKSNNSLVNFIPFEQKVQTGRLTATVNNIIEFGIIGNGWFKLNRFPVDQRIHIGKEMGMHLNSKFWWYCSIEAVKITLLYSRLLVGCAVVGIVTVFNSPSLSLLRWIAKRHKHIIQKYTNFNLNWMYIYIFNWYEDGEREREWLNYNR